MTTAAADAMKQVVAMCTPLLRAAGFKKRRHTFNRTTADGLVHVTNFQMGAFDPPGTQEFPPIRVNLYGKFTVNIGVFVEEVARVLEAKEASSWLNQYECHLRERLGSVTPAAADLWWSLDDVDSAAAEVNVALSDFGLPWLDGLSSREQILAAYDAKGRTALGMPPAAPLFLAVIRLQRGERDDAEALLRFHLADQLRPSHRRYVEELLPKLGMAHLVHP